MKGEVKKNKRFCAEDMKHAIKAVFGIFALAMMAYGLVYAPMKQLEVAQGNLLISNQAIQLAEAKDIKKCASLAEQQLAQQLSVAKKDKKEVTENDKKKFAESVYLNCLSFEARDYIVNQVVAEQKAIEVAKESKESKDKK